MDTTKLALTIEGTPTLEQYTTILRRLKALLGAIAEDVAPGVQVQWTVESPHNTALDISLLPGVD